MPRAADDDEGRLLVAKTVDKDRKAKIAQMQRQAKAAERKRTLTIVGAAAVIVVLMAGAVTYAIVSDENRVPGGELASLGVAATAASCDPVTNDKTTGSGEHVGPGTAKPDEVTVKYATIPPSSGPHSPQWEFPNRGFYTADDRPRMENLVHNLEHGYTVLWYDDTTTDKQIATLKAVGKKANESTAAREKFIISAWDPAYGALPSGKHFALSHWSADGADTTKQAGHRQLCGDLSGAVVNEFITAYPRTSAPEPDAS